MNSTNQAISTNSSATGPAGQLKVGTWGKPATRREERLQEQCKHFEAVLTGEMLKAMRKTVTESKGWFGESQGERMSREMFDERLCDVLAQRGALTVGRTVYEKVRAGMGADSLPKQAGGSLA